MKKFTEVKIGDKGTEYFGILVSIKDKGTVSEMLKKHGHNSSLCLSDFTEFGYTKDSNAVAVTSDEFGGAIVYVYGDGGVTVSK